MSQTPSSASESGDENSHPREASLDPGLPFVFIQSCLIFSYCQRMIPQPPRTGSRTTKLASLGRTVSSLEARLKKIWFWIKTPTMKKAAATTLGPSPMTSRTPMMPQMLGFQSREPKVRLALFFCCDLSIISHFNLVAKDTPPPNQAPTVGKSDGMDGATPANNAVTPADGKSAPGKLDIILSLCFFPNLTLSCSREGHAAA